MPNALVTALIILLPGLSSAAWPKLNPATAPAGGGEKDAALIVAIEEYDSAPDILGARQNAVDWQIHLSDTLKIPVVKLLLDGEATHGWTRDGGARGILAEVESVAKQVKPGGTFWFLFIGHGAPSTKGGGLLLGADVRQSIDSFETRGVPVRAELLPRLAKAPRAVALLDACFSGLDGSGKTLTPGLQPLINDKLIDEVSPEPQGQLDPLEKVTVLTAAGANQFAGSLPGLDRPAFSYLALGALRGWADQDGDGVVRAKEIQTFIDRSLIIHLKGRRQTPSLIGPAQVILASKARERAPDFSPARPLQQDAAAAGAPVQTGSVGIQWVSIPGGSFQMGSKRADEEGPIHEVNIPAFSLSMTEVTVTQYAACVKAGACSNKGLRQRGSWCNWGRAAREQHPINCITWEQAQMFCEWVGGRLPSEAEWEYAARRSGKGRYPWGRKTPNCQRARFGSCGPGTASIGGRQAGASADGLLDMAGNLWEWTEDAFSDSYIDAPIDGSPREDGEGRVTRGGAWRSGPEALIISHRSWNQPDRRRDIIGFRVARDAK